MGGGKCFEFSGPMLRMIGKIKKLNEGKIIHGNPNKGRCTSVHVRLACVNGGEFDVCVCTHMSNAPPIVFSN